MFKKIMKDERGLSLVELLAVVVIMAVIAGIGAVAITGVIQRNREDAAVSSLQNLTAAANLYQTSNVGDPDKSIPASGNKVTGQTLLDEGFITSIGSLVSDNQAAKIVFNVVDGKLKVTVDGDVFKAGSKQNKPMNNMSEDTVAKLTRKQFFEDGIGTTTP
ncbi:type IV pilin protein [Enterococcus sp. UD-01]|jgi:type IV pilus assembly protein PilA|uniref:type IV pilin protein n=1 Tax=Enterococcus sp. UD-01 TaxID=3373911 RepID=UPI003835A08D